MLKCDGQIATCSVSTYVCSCSSLYGMHVCMRWYIRPTTTGESLLGTSVVFLNQMQQYRPPPVEFPFLPTVTSSAGQLLLEAYQNADCAAVQGPVIAHQLCALQIFQARINRSRYVILPSLRAL